MVKANHTQSKPTMIIIFWYASATQTNMCMVKIPMF